MPKATPKKAKPCKATVIVTAYVGGKTYGKIHSGLEGNLRRVRSWLAKGLAASPPADAVARGAKPGFINVIQFDYAGHTRIIAACHNGKWLKDWWTPPKYRNGGIK